MSLHAPYPPPGSTPLTRQPSQPPKPQNLKALKPKWVAHTLRPHLRGVALWVGGWGCNQAYSSTVHPALLATCLLSCLAATSTAARWPTRGLPPRSHVRFLGKWLYLKRSEVFQFNCYFSSIVISVQLLFQFKYNYISCYILLFQFKLFHYFIIVQLLMRFS